MAQSEKVFRETLCESRSYGVETIDPTGARTIDELRRQTKELRAQLEGEKVKFRQTQREHERRLQQIRDEEAMRLDAALEACSVRKEQEKLNELKKLEDRLYRQRDQDLRMLRKEKMEELNRSLRKWQLQKNEAVRLAAEVERRKSSEEFQAQYSEEEAQSREAKLTREVFILGEQNEALEEQVRNLTKLNRSQIDQMRRLKMESDMKVENVIKQHKVEASREVAQLKLAEQILADKEHHLQHSEYRADMAQMEKEALQEELVAIKSIHNTSLSSSIHETSQHEAGGTPTRRTGVLQRRLEELESQIKKLEEDKGTLKQDNAALRKRLLQDDSDKKGGGELKSAMEDKLKMLRKKNSELTALTKQLDDKYKALKVEHDQLQKSRGNAGEGDNVKKLMARQHAKDISEYTKQIMAKDKELNLLKKKLGKLEVAAVSRSEPAPELEKKLKLMALDKLQTERIMAKLYSRLPDVVDTENLSHKDLTTESKKMEELVSGNESLRGEVRALQLQVAMLQKPTDSTGMSQKEASSRIAALEQDNGRLISENKRLTELSRSASQLEVKVKDFRETVEQLEEDKSMLEQTSHQLRQELEISTMAVKELQSTQDSTGELEKEVECLKDELRLKEERHMVLKREMAETSNQVTGQQIIITTLQNNVDQAELEMSEKDQRCADLQATVDKAREDLEALSHTASLHSMGTQVDIVDDKEAARSRTVSLPSTSSMSAHDTPIDNSMQVLTKSLKSLPTTTEAEATVATPTSMAPALLARSGSGGGPRQFPSKDRIRSPKRRSLRSLSPRTSSGELQDSSLDHEMRAAGFDFTNSGDSSEGVEFSEPNLDAVVLESDPSFEKNMAEKTQEGVGLPLPTVAWEEKAESKENGGVTSDALDRVLQRGTDQAQATSDSNVDGGVTKEEGHAEDDGQALLNRLLPGGGVDDYHLPDDGEDTMNESSHLSYSSDGEQPTSLGAKASYEAAESEGSPASFTDDKVGIYIAKYTYVPSEMSPNENYDLELLLTAGDYLYVYGEMDSDGYYHGQLLTGESGMVPSNFIDRVMDEEEALKPPKAQLAQLHDIEEVDEDASSGGGRGIPPPRGLTLDRQFVEGDEYSVVIKWEPPSPLPEGVTGYNIYVNEEFNYDVVGTDQTSVLLTGIPRKQLVKISVRTVTEEGESANPQKRIILNPQYPESPTNVLVSRSDSPSCLVVQWTPSQPLKEGNPINGYVVCLNKHTCIEVGGNSTPAKTVCAQIFPTDVNDVKQKLLRDKTISLTVHARSSNYLSSPSVAVVVSREDFIHIYGGEMSERTSSEASLSSLEDDDEEKVGFSSAGKTNGKKREDVQANEVEIITVETNGLEVDGEETHNGHYNAARFYRALACYNPHMQSPNKDLVDEELGFLADDIIIGLAEVDEDGFLMGKLDSKTGYVPSNLVEEITDDEELARIRAILREKGTLRQDLGDLQQRDVNGSGLLTQGEGGKNAVRTMVAEYDYNPVQDSPNEITEEEQEELALTEGQVVTVFGWADEDGFVKAEIGGKKGLVPGNYLKDLQTPPKNNEVEVFAADEEDMKQADAIIHSKTQPDKSQNQKTDEGTASSKRKGGVLSRGKNLFTRGKKGGQ